MFLTNAVESSKIYSSKFASKVNLSNVEGILAESDSRMFEYDMKMAKLEHAASLSENSVLYEEGVKEWFAKAKKWVSEKVTAIIKWIKELIAKIISFFSSANKKYAIVSKNKNKIIKNLGSIYKDDMKISFPVANISDITGKIDAALKVIQNESAKSSVIEKASGRDEVMKAVFGGKDYKEQKLSPEMIYNNAMAYKAIDHMKSTLQSAQNVAQKESKYVVANLAYKNNGDKAAGDQAANAQKRFRFVSGGISELIRTVNACLSISSKCLNACYAAFKTKVKSEKKSESFNFGGKTSVLDNF